MAEPDMPESNGIYTSYGGFLPNVDHFDAMLFNISPVEAESMDPQERLFLQTVWEVFEDAGYSRTNKYRWGKNVGVFVGVMNNDYEFVGGADWGRRKLSSAHSAFWSHANRVSYFFDLHGPSLTVDTACSSSLTAIHLACESLKRGECETAIAGGVNLILHPMHYIRLCQMNMLSREDRCKSFGLGADGFVAGEGVGAVLLKPLQQAVEDKDQIYGVIKGSAVNAGGKTGGYTVPNPNAQADVILHALNYSGIHPRTISYFEAHGTGTTLGDPIEVQGITKAFSQFTKDRQYCALGSSKANIGHLESAAGIAALTKVLLQLKHRKIVPSIHTEMINPAIDLRDSPLYIPQQLNEWKNPIHEMNEEGESIPLRAAISSFGAGGANAHLIVEEYSRTRNAQVEYKAEHEDQLFILSAKHEEQLNEYVIKMLDQLEEFARETNGEVVSFERICYTLQTAREPLEERLAVIAKDINDLKRKLTGFLEHRRHPQVYISKLPDSLEGTGSLMEESFEITLNSLRSETASLLELREEDIDVTEDLVDSGFEDPIKLEQFKEVLRIRFGLFSYEDISIERSTLTDIAKQISGANSFDLEPVSQSNKVEPGTINLAIKSRDLAKLAFYWVHGTKVEWENLYSGEHPLRCSLPTYPFAKDRYWAESVNTEGTDVERLSPLIQTLHPLVYVNVSTLKGIEFESRFSGQEFYLRDHKFQNYSLLPASCYLEMARAAGKEAAQRRIEGIRGIVWLEPYAPELGEQPLSISLESEGDNVTFTMKSQHEEMLHCKGELLYSSSELISPFQHPFKAVNLINQLHLLQPIEDSFYDAFSKLGLTYGTSFHVLQGVYLQKNNALVKYRMPEMIKEASKDFHLNPVILDGGIQAASFLVEKQSDLLLPFSIDEIRWNGALPTEGFIYVEKEGDPQAVHKFNIQIADYKGQLAVEMRGVSLVKVRKEDKDIVESGDFTNWDSKNVHYFTKKWAPMKNVSSSVQSTIRTVMVLDHDTAFSNILQPLGGAEVRVICVINEAD